MGRNCRKRIWITWERQRRSVELSRVFDTRFYELLFKGSRPLRALVLSLKTTKIIHRNRPVVLFVQNPSMVLATLACLLRPFYGYSLVVDRHSNFIFTSAEARQFSALVAFFQKTLSDFTIKRADLTIVTNSYLKALVERKGGRGWILQDKLPDMESGKRLQLAGNYNVIYPCSFNPDEPVQSVIEAARCLPPDIYIYITGNINKFIPANSRPIPENIIFTGFLFEEQFQSYLQSGDAVLTLTDRDHTLLCCAYESVAMGKPMVMSKHAELNEYFNKGRIVTTNEPENLASAIIKSAQIREQLSQEIVQLKIDLQIDWRRRYEQLERIIVDL